MIRPDGKPWLPGSFPMPEPLGNWSRLGGGVVPFAKPPDPPEIIVHPELPVGTYVGGLPQNIVNSLMSCVEGENAQYRIRAEWLERISPTHLEVPGVPTPQRLIDPYGGD